MPFSAFTEIINYCNEKEIESGKIEIEKRIFPLWLVSFSLSKFSEVFPTAEVLEVPPYDEFINSVLNAEKDKTIEINKKTPDEILKEFLPIIKKDKGG